MDETKKDPIAVELGRRGSLKGGPARAKVLTGEERAKIAMKAAEARWGTRCSDCKRKLHHTTKGNYAWVGNVIYAEVKGKKEVIHASQFCLACAFGLSFIDNTNLKSWGITEHPWKEYQYQMNPDYVEPAERVKELEKQVDKLNAELIRLRNPTSDFNAANLGIK